MKPHPRIRTVVKWGGLALLVLLVAMWVRSAYAREGLNIGRWQLTWQGGALIGGHFPRPASGPWVVRWEIYAPAGTEWWLSGHGGEWGMLITLPIWMPLAAVVGATVAAWWPSILALRPDRRGKCPKCLYDRAGLAPGAVCPECGTSPAKA